jgi:hypothetical protein
MHEIPRRRYSFSWPVIAPPAWGTQLIQLTLKVLHNQEISMAAIDDLTTSVQGIVTEVTVVATTLDTLAAEVAKGNPVSEQQLGALNTQLVNSLATLQSAVAKDGPPAPAPTP